MNEKKEAEKVRNTTDEIIPDDLTLKEKLFNRWSIWWFQVDQKRDLDSLFKKELNNVIRKEKNNLVTKIKTDMKGIHSEYFHKLINEYYED